jgi:hypothetical protein
MHIVATQMTRFSLILFALFGVLLSTTSASADEVSFGPPPGAKLFVEKLAAIDDFVNGEVESSGFLPRSC